MMSENDWWNRNVFSCRRKELKETDGADWTSSGRVFQKMDAATGNERRPVVDRRYAGMCSCSVNDDRRRRRPGRLDTGTSWLRYGDAIPFKTRFLPVLCTGTVTSRDLTTRHQIKRRARLNRGGPEQSSVQKPRGREWRYATTSNIRRRVTHFIRRRTVSFVRRLGSCHVQTTTSHTTGADNVFRRSQLCSKQQALYAQLYRASLAGRSWTNQLQTRYAYVPMPAQQSSSVPDFSIRRCLSSTATFCQ